MKRAPFDAEVVEPQYLFPTRFHSPSIDGVESTMRPNRNLTMRLRPLRLLTLSLPLVALLSACGGDAPAPDTAGDEAAPRPTVRIVEPANGAEIDGTEFRVVLEVTGINVAPVAEGIPGSAHHHLFINEDVTPLDQIIPVNRAGIIHLGDGSAEYWVRDVAPGSIRLIAVLADLLHVPLSPPVMDTIFITVR